MEGPSAPPKKRRRPALSCEQCRKRKVRCDREQPCGPCGQSKITPCTYSTPPPSASKPMAYEAATGTPFMQSSMHQPSIDQALIRAVESVEYPTPASARSQEIDPYGQVAGSSTHTVAESTTPSIPAKRPRTENPDLESLHVRMKAIEKKLSEPVKPRTLMSNSSWQGAGKFEPYKGTFVKMRYCGPSSWARYIEHFKEIRGFSRSVAKGNPSPSNLEIFNGLQRNKATAKLTKLSRRTEAPSIPELRASIPDIGTCERLVHHYMRLINPIYQIVHLRTFRTELQDFWKAPEAAADGFFHKFLLMMAIGTTYHEERESHPAGLSALARAWILAAFKWLSGSFDRGRFDLDFVQVHCLLLLSRDIVSVKWPGVLVSGGSLLRAAMQLGMHREPKTLPQGGARPAPPITPLGAEIRRRLWYTVVELALQAATEWGLPTMISFDDFDTEPPSNYGDEEYDEATTSLPSPRPTDMVSNSSLQILLYKTLQIRLDIAKSSNSRHPLPSYDYVLHLGTRLLDSCNLNKLMCQARIMTSRPGQAVEFDFHQKYVDSILRISLMDLHWPFASISYEDPLFYFSRKVCLDSALVFMSYMDNTHFATMMTRGGLHFRGIMAHSTCPVYIELLSHLRDDSGDGLMTSRQDAMWHPLRDAAGKGLALAAERVKAGESNVKAHLFYSMAVGQIDAIVQGNSVDAGIYEAARNSLQFTYDILRARTPEMMNASLSTTAPGIPQQNGGEVGMDNGGAIVVNGMMTDNNDPLKDIWTDISLDNLPNMENEGPWVLFGWDGAVTGF